MSQLRETERAQALRLLLDEVVVDADHVTLVGVLPGLGETPPVPESSPSVYSREGNRHPAHADAPRYVLTVPWASRR